jgi:lipoprotein NlpI
MKYRASGKRQAAATIALTYSHDLPAKWTTEETKIFNDFGFFLSEECFLDEASQLLQSVLAHDSSRTSAFLNLADNLRYSGESDSAKVVYEKYLDTFGKSQAKGKPAWWALFLTGKANNPQKAKVPMPRNCAI